MQSHKSVAENHNRLADTACSYYMMAICHSDNPLAKNSNKHKMISAEKRFLCEDVCH